MNRLAYRIKELAEVTPYSEDTIRRAIKATDPRVFPPPLEAGKDTKGYLILATDAQTWLERIKATTEWAA